MAVKKTAKKTIAKDPSDVERAKEGLKKYDKGLKEKAEKLRMEKVIVKNVKKIIPRYTSVLTTMDIYDAKELQRQSGIIDTSKQVMSVKEFQKVIAVGDMVRGIKPGDIIAFSPKAYEKKKYQENSLKDGIIKMNPTIDYDFPIVILDNIPFLLLNDRDITYVVAEYE